MKIIQPINTKNEELTMKKNKINAYLLLGTLSVCSVYGAGDSRLDDLERRVAVLEDKLNIGSAPVSKDSDLDHDRGMLLDESVSSDSVPKYSVFDHDKDMFLHPLTEGEIDKLSLEDLDTYISEHLKIFSGAPYSRGVLAPPQTVDLDEKTASALEVSPLFHKIHFVRDITTTPYYQKVGEGSVVHGSYNITFGKFARSLEEFVTKHPDYLNKKIITGSSGFETIADILTTNNALIVFINQLYDQVGK